MTISLPFRFVRAAIAVALLASCAIPALAQQRRAVSSSPIAEYRWSQLTPAAAFPTSYNFPVVVREGRFWAIHPRGTWSSLDGVTWRREALPFSGLNDAYLSHVLFRGSLYALGNITGNYLNFAHSARILRTDDFARWRAIGVSATLPKRIFYGAIVFRDAIYMIGGFDGRTYYNDVWRSVDALHWERVLEHAPWSPRSNPTLAVFNGRLILIGGGVIDGPVNSQVWSTADGTTWRKDAEHVATPDPFGFEAISWSGRLWLLGANRNGAFTSELLSSDDGVHFVAARAPWSPRGGIAAWSRGDSLFITGGKYSTGSGENIRFVYSNDVWMLTKSPR